MSRTITLWSIDCHFYRVFLYLLKICDSLNGHCSRCFQPKIENIKYKIEQCYFSIKSFYFHGIFHCGLESKIGKPYYQLLALWFVIQFMTVKPHFNKYRLMHGFQWVRVT